MDQLAEIFDRLATILQSSKLAIQVDHDNLETVNITRDPGGSFLVSDCGYTVDYLENDQDNYLAPDDLIPPIREICSSHDVELVNVDENDANLLPILNITKRANTDDEIRMAVSGVAACMDEIFDRAFKR